MTARGLRVMLVNDCPLGIPGAGGVEGHVEQVAEALADAGHRPILVTGQSREAPEAHEDGHHRIPNLSPAPLRKHQLQHMHNKQAALRTLNRVIESESPDIIHVHNLLHPPALRMIRLLRPAVKSIHDCRPFCVKPTNGVATRLVGKTTTFCDETLGPTCWRRCYAHSQGSLKDRLEAWSYYPRNIQALKEVAVYPKLLVASEYLCHLATRCVADPRRIELLHLFSDTEEQAAKAAGEGSRDDNAPPTILFAGRHSKEKGVLHLLAALQRIRVLRFTAVIAGNGPQHEQLQAAIAQSGMQDRIHLPGFLPRDEFLNLCATASLAVVPSIGSEGCPLTGIECMHFGIPLVAYDVGGVGEWLIHGVTGLSVSRGDIDGLARAIAALLTDTHHRCQLGRQARDLANQRFRRQRHVSRLIELYREVMESSDAPSERVRSERRVPWHV